MFAKIALTVLIIAVVFLLGRSSGMARVRDLPRKARSRRSRVWGRSAPPPPPAVEDLIECPFCGSHVPATERCRCRDTTDRN